MPRTAADSDRAAGWRRGRRIGVDVGSVRVGVAICDPDGILATPLTTLAREREPREGARTSGEPDARVPADIAALARLVLEYDCVEVVVGLPVNLSGVEGPAAIHVREYVERLEAAIDPAPVRLADERMSTAAAARRLSERGVRGRRQRAVVDQVAAVEILQNWLDAHRRQMS